MSLPPASTTQDHMTTVNKYQKAAELSLDLLHSPQNARNAKASNSQIPPALQLSNIRSPTNQQVIAISSPQNAAQSQAYNVGQMKKKELQTILNNHDASQQNLKQTINLYTKSVASPHHVGVV